MTRPEAEIPPRASSRKKTLIDAMAFSVLEDTKVKRQIQRAAKLETTSVLSVVVKAVESLFSSPRPDPLSPLQIHEKLIKGVPGEALFLSGALAFDSFKESQSFFQITAKTAKERIGHQLDLGESEKALRLTRAYILARLCFGDAKTARDYLKTPNFALGGKSPRELLQTAEGEPVVINEINAQNDAAPL
jgi:putative toxin-antitoxin system antitoxin component (TIGR02293 family)